MRRTRQLSPTRCWHKETKSDVWSQNAFPGQILLPTHLWTVIPGSILLKLYGFVPYILKSSLPDPRALLHMSAQ